MRLVVRCVLTGLVTLAAVAVGAEDVVSGSITVDGIAIEPAHAVAVRTVAGWEQQEVVRVYLSPTALDPAAVVDALDPESALEEQIPGDYAAVTLNPDGSLVSVYAYFDDGARNFATYHGEIEEVTLDGRRVAGRVFTRQPETLVRSVISFDLRFQADLLPERQATATLPADGGPPGAAYLAYVRGWQQGDRELLTAHGERSRVAAFAEMDGQTVAYLLESGKETAHKEAKVTGGALYDGYAILTVSGRDWSDDPFAGKVKMIRDGDSWRLEEEKLGPAD